MRFIQFIKIVFLALALNGCSLVKTVYSNAPEAMHWWLDGYLNFTQSQNALLKPALHKLHDWHRKTQLPLYVKLLQQVQHDLSEEKIDADAVCATIDTVQDQLQTIQLEAMPTIMEIAPTLTDKQMEYFEKKLNKRAHKWQSEWFQETAEDQLAARLEKMIDYSERLYGRLSQSQQAMLRQKLANANFKPELSYKEILRRNEDALQTVSALKMTKLSNTQRQELLSQAFHRLRTSPNLVFQQYADQAKQRSCEIFADLHATTDNKQKQHAIEWLENLIIQFKALSNIAAS